MLSQNWTDDEASWFYNVAQGSQLIPYKWFLALTEIQGDKVAAWAKQLANGCVTLMFDCEPSGIDGAKEALWFFAQRMLDVRLAWTPWMHGGKFVGKQPENVSREE